jgi:hypothetical protein
MGDDPTDERISTANTNATVRKSVLIDEYGEPDRMVILSGIEDTHDLITMQNRIMEEHGSIDGVESIDTVVIVYCDDY